MHMVIGAIVYAHNEEEALVKARNTFEKLCGEGQAFDYYVLFDEELPMAGKSRWGNLPVVARADSPEGKKLIDSRMQATKNEFMQDMAQIREGLLNLTDEELFNEELGPNAIAMRAFETVPRPGFSFDPSMIKYFVRLAGEYVGPSVYLYDNDGEGIRTPRYLNNVLNKWDDADEYKDLDIFIVPADVHH